MTRSKWLQLMNFEMHEISKSKMHIKYLITEWLWSHNEFLASTPVSDLVYPVPAADRNGGHEYVIISPLLIFLPAPVALIASWIYYLTPR